MPRPDPSGYDPPPPAAARSAAPAVPGDPAPWPSRFPFHELDNVLMTPHLSGWTFGTRRRRQETMADNVNRLRAGRPLVNVVRSGRG